MEKKFRKNLVLSRPVHSKNISGLRSEDVKPNHGTKEEDEIVKSARGQREGQLQLQQIILPKLHKPGTTR